MTNVWFSYGENIPNVLESADFLFWGAGKYAASIKQTLPNTHFQSPGAYWLSTVPTEYLQRVIHTTTFTKALEDLPAEVWLKLAEMKHEALPAKQYTKTELQTIYSTYPELGTCIVQWTETVLNLNYEHRFFILNDKPVTGSPYLIDNIVYNKNMSWEKYAEAQDFAATVTETMAGKSPDSYVLDVALNDNSTWVVVEANRTWSSGLYGSEVKEVMKSLHVSMQPSNFEWKPDEIVHTYATKLNLVESPDATGLIAL